MAGDVSASVDIVMVPRERYRPTVDSVASLLATAPDDVRLILVRGGMPKSIEDRAREVGRGRIEVVGPRRHLAPNAARAVGLDHTTSPYVIFLDNDVTPSRDGSNRSSARLWSGALGPSDRACSRGSVIR